MSDHSGQKFLLRMEMDEIDESTKNNEFLGRQKKFQILKREIKLGFCFVFVIAAFTYDWVRLILSPQSCADLKHKK